MSELSKLHDRILELEEENQYFLKQYNELRAKLHKTEIQLQVAKDAQLRTYDGLTEKADKYDELRAKLERAEAELARLQFKIDETIDIFVIERLREQLTTERARTQALVEAMEAYCDDDINSAYEPSKGRIHDALYEYKKAAHGAQEGEET